MATIKNYTDIEQSKKLAEILPIESADMYYQYVLPKSDKIKHIPEIGNPEEALEWYNKGYTHFGKEPLSLKEYCIPCWGLAALLDILPKGKVLIDDVHSNKYKVIGYNLDTDYYDEPLDACYEMVLKLHEQKLL
jgi:hypothetical protein